MTHPDSSPPPGGHSAENAHLSDEERMFLAADIRDELAEVSVLPFGDRNRIAWDTVDAVYPPGERGDA